MEEGFPKYDAAAIFDRYVDGYIANHFNVDKYASGLNLFIQNLPSHSPIRLLDIACGPGNLTHYVQSQKHDALCHGIDLSPQMVEAAKKLNPKAHFDVLDIRETAQLDGQFEGILLGFGLPYLSEVEGVDLLNAVEDKLVSGGMLFVTTTLGSHNAKLEYSSKGDGVWQFLWGAKELKAQLANGYREINSEILTFQYGQRPPVEEFIGVYQRV